MKNKLIILVGISGSGKSTWSAQTVQHNPGRYVRISRDKIREMLYGYTEENVSEYYHRSNIHKLEQQVTQVEDNLIKFLLKERSVIVDATHLRPKYLNRFEKFDNEKEIILFETPLEIAKERNNARIRKVDEDIITKQYESFLNLNKFLTGNELKFDYICKNK